MKKFSYLFNVFSLGLFCAAVPAQAAIMIDFAEVGSDVVVTTTGSLDMSGLTGPATGSVDGVWLGYAGIAGAFSGSTNSYDSPVDGFTSWSADITQNTNERHTTNLDLSGFNALFGFIAPSKRLFVPDGYSGAIVNSEIVMEGYSFQSLGIVEGVIASLTFTTDSGGDSMTLTAVPEPSAFAAFAGFLALGLVACCRRTEKRVRVSR